MTFDVEGWPASEIKAALRRDGINISLSGPRASPIDGARRDLGAMVRASVHAFNTEDEVDLLTRFIAAGP